jgi:hypothetical protein
MATYYNIDSENQKYFENVNVQALPIVIKDEFDKIYQSYELFGVEIEGDEDFYIATNNNTFNSLLDLLQRGELYISISDDLISNEQATINNGFEKLEDQNLTYYRIKNKDSFDWIKSIYYSKPFIFGYNYNFDSDYEIFSAVCKKYNGSLSDTDNLFSENYKASTIDSNYLIHFAEEEGRFIKAWKEILKRPIDFELLFSQAEISHVNSSLEWNGTPTELMELIKSLIENRSIKGGTQKEMISIFSDFFGIEIKNPDKLIQDIKKRNNGSETLFLEKLKTSLFDYIQK